MNTGILIPSGDRTWPQQVMTDWRRFSSGLWRVPEGDINAAYSAESFPKVKVFTHHGALMTNAGGHFSGPVAAAADCYPLIPASEYRGPEPRRYTYEGCEACYQGSVFKLGPKIVFTAADATVEEWRRLLRSMYADGGRFARHSNYGLFLNADNCVVKSDNAREALTLELTCDFLTRSKVEMQRFLDGQNPSAPPEKLQLDLPI